jgi:regulator of sigma E protease
MLIFLGLLLFISLVLVHEWGHFKVARRNGVEVEEFGLFFPPRIKTLTKKNGTEYTLNWLPLGGFVKLKGENDADRRPGTFGAASFGVKARILLAGVGMNLLTAFVMLMILAWVGMPKLVDNQFTVQSDANVIRQEVLNGRVTDNSPAAKAGIERGAVLKTIQPAQGNIEQISSAERLPQLTERFAGQKVTIQYVHQGEKTSKTLTLLSNEEVEKSLNTDNPQGNLGIRPVEYTVERSTWSAPVVAGGLLAQFTSLTFKGLGTAVVSIFQGDTKKASEQVAGPVGVFAVLQQGSLFGFEFVLLVIAIISLSLAIMNALPIPALDGGRLFVLAVSRVLKKPLTKEAEENIHGLGFMFLIGLIILITIVDVRRFY